MLTRTALALIVLAACLRAQTPPEPSAFEFGFEQRVRNENWNNITDYSDRRDDERQQIRYRTRAWAKAPLGHDIDFFVGINQETCDRIGQDNSFDEVIFDAAYLDFKRILTDGLALRVGRQNLMRGEGFILLDGGPWDGSRAIYHNAVDLSYTRGKSKIELIGILNPKRDRMLPRFHDQSKNLVDWDESALGSYFTHASGVEAYYFYKRETNATRPALGGRFQPDRHIHTAGGRTVRKLRPGWTATAEFAYQWGFERPASNISAWGGYGYVRRTWSQRAWKPYVQAGYWAMSGDDPATGRYEGWDPLWSRWPKWSEGYIYSQMREVSASYWTNTAMWQAELGATPRKPLGLRLTYYRMKAFHPFPGDPGIFGEGRRRGDNLQGRLDFAMGQHWNGHALYETHIPGSFYRAQNSGYFLRFELAYSVTARVTSDHLKHAFGR
jgi:hypothetical protein